MKYTFEAEVTTIMKINSDPNDTRYQSGIEFNTGPTAYSAKTIHLPVRLELGKKMLVVVTDEGGWPDTESNDAGCGAPSVTEG